MKEIITWQASVKVNGQYYMLPEKPVEDVTIVTKLVEKAVLKLSYHYFTVTYVRNVAIVKDKV